MRAPTTLESSRNTAFPAEQERLIAGSEPSPAQQALMIAQQELLIAAQGALIAQQDAMSAAHALPFTAQSLLSAQQTLLFAQHKLMIREQSLLSAQQRRRHLSRELLQRPAAVLFNGLIDFRHEALCFHQRPDDAHVFLLLDETQRATDAVFQPALCRQITANRESPRRFRHAFDVLPVVDPDAARLFALRRLVAAFFTRVGALDREANSLWLAFAARVQVHQVAAEAAKDAAQLEVACERQAGEIRAKEFSITLAIGGTVKHGVGIMENQFRPDFAFAGTAQTIWHELDLQLLAKIFDELGAQVRTAPVVVRKQIFIWQLSVRIKVER